MSGRSANSLAAIARTFGGAPECVPDNGTESDMWTRPVAPTSAGHECRYVAGMPDEATWSDYYEANEGRAPRDQLLDVLATFAEPGNAVDLGCGAGIDTLAMLDRGWTVVAIDAEPEAIERVRRRAAERPSLETQLSPMEDVDLPPADLVWASYSLFFWIRLASPMSGRGSRPRSAAAAGSPASCSATATPGPRCPSEPR